MAKSQVVGDLCRDCSSKRLLPVFAWVIDPTTFFTLRYPDQIPRSGKFYIWVVCVRAGERSQDELAGLWVSKHHDLKQLNSLEAIYRDSHVRRTVLAVTH